MENSSNESSSKINSLTGNDDIIDLLNKICQYCRKFSGSFEMAKSENLQPIYIEGMVETCEVFIELLEQIHLFGKSHLKMSSVSQINNIIFTISEFDKLIISYVAPGKLIKGSKKFPFLKLEKKDEVEIENNVKIDTKAILVYAMLIESLFIARLLIIDIQYDVLYDESVKHEEQINRMEILV
jgi:hypothetical protein